MEAGSTQRELTFGRPSEESLLIRLAGAWTVEGALPSAEEVARQIESDSGIRHVAIDTKDLAEWDSALLTFLIRVKDQCSRSEAVLDEEGLPPGVRRLLALARAKGTDTAFLEVRVSNHLARALYASEGFCEIGARRGYYPARNGREDAVVLARAL